MNKRIKMSMGVGAASLIMIFVVLAAVTLSTLAFGTARADYKLAEKSAEAIKQFYKADTKAEELLAKVNETLSVTEQEVWQQELAKMPELVLTDEKAQLKISYQVPVNHKQTLNVALTANKKVQSGKSKCHITGFYVQNNQEWDYEETLGFDEITIGQ